MVLLFHTKIHTFPYKNPYSSIPLLFLILSFSFFSSLLLLLFLLLFFFSSPLFFTLRFVLSKNERPIWSHPLLTFNFPFIALCLQTLLYFQIKLCHLYNNLPFSYIMSFVSHFGKLQIYPCILYKFRVSKFSHLGK